MKRLIILITLSVLAVGLAPALPSTSQTPAESAMGKLRALAGEWDGRITDGRTVRATFQVISAGASVLQTEQVSGRKETTTVYYLDGDQLMATHYCSVKNQPRFRTSKLEDPNELTFSFVDVTNLGSLTHGHVRGAVITFQDNDHHSQAWTWRENGQEYTELTHFTRKK